MQETLCCQGVKAIHSPHTGIVDWAEVTHYYAKEFKQLGGVINLNYKVTGFDIVNEEESQYPVSIHSNNKVGR